MAFYGSQHNWTICDNIWLVLTRSDSFWLECGNRSHLAASWQVVRKSAESTRAYESLRESTRVYESLRESTRVYESLRESTRVYEGLRESTRVYESLRHKDIEELQDHTETTKDTKAQKEPFRALPSWVSLWSFLVPPLTYSRFQQTLPFLSASQLGPQKVSPLRSDQVGEPPTRSQVLWNLKKNFTVFGTTEPQLSEQAQHGFSFRSSKKSAGISSFSSVSSISFSVSVSDSPMASKASVLWITSSDMLSLGSGFSFASICGPARAASAKLRKSRNKTARMAGLKTQQKDSQKFRAKLGLNHRRESWLSLIIIDYPDSSCCKLKITRSRGVSNPCYTCALFQHVTRVAPTEIGLCLSNRRPRQIAKMQSYVYIYIYMYISYTIILSFIHSIVFLLLLFLSLSLLLMFVIIMCSVYVLQNLYNADHSSGSGCSRRHALLLWSMPPSPLVVGSIRSLASSPLQGCTRPFNSLGHSWKFHMGSCLVCLVRLRSYLRPKGRGRKLVGHREICIERICGATFWVSVFGL